MRMFSLTPNLLNFSKYVTFLLFQQSVTRVTSYEKNIGSKHPVEVDSNSKPNLRRELIGGGTAVENGRYPYAAALYDRWWGRFCTGTLIHAEWVLSAAHCNAYGPKWVQVGIRDSEDSSEIEGVDYDEIRVESVVLHPNWKDDGSFEYDFMLLKLSKPSQFLPIRLDDGSTIVNESTTFTNFGWGETESADFSNVLLEVDFNYINFDECNETFFGALSEDMFCAGTETEWSGNGDSGGPVFIKGDNAEDDLQIGVTSWGRDDIGLIPTVYGWVFMAQEFVSAVIEGGGIEELNDDDCGIFEGIWSDMKKMWYGTASSENDYF